ncbi:GNAT family N-acetyltransferase [Agromyces intestinalis]|uniref:GNAT family N-acetyltransferase n=1 Tax=Agromyces intestinalis TaxID=2592652 RepID=A0A5C1YJ03_9MICO|nr:GNAT family protein [Agromyces intestinalis]QEO14752.1 GNAT family N-acetyltransferase [Agromyces intestinalis]
MTTSVRPPAEPLIGRFIRLDPFSPDDLPGLRTALVHAEVFAGGYGGGPAGLPRDDVSWAEFAAGQWQPSAVSMPWTIRLVGGPDHDTIVGTSTIGDLDVRHDGAHIGWTGYDPRVWGTAVNPEAKRLLLGLAFDHGFERVRIQADSINARSRGAIEKLGAVFEGVMRHDRRRADGSWRDTAVYSVLRDEWPRVRAGLDARLAAFEGAITLG